MILSGQEIKKHMGKEIIIEPLTRRELIPTVTICHSLENFWFMIITF